ncbi:MAG: hypothetical protein IJU95_03210 [Treponema sp.]|nr:hypothetical protein [Treponema sp.]
MSSEEKELLELEDEPGLYISPSEYEEPPLPVQEIKNAECRIKNTE